MLRNSFVAALCALTLGGCAHHRFIKAPDPSRPQVSVAPGGYLVVNQEPIVVARPRGSTSVVNFQLAAGSGFSFEGDKKGVVVVGRIKTVAAGKPPSKLERPDPSQNERFQCTTVNDGLEVNCVLLPGIDPGLYLYVINARNKEGQPVVLDPTMWVSE